MCLALCKCLIHFGLLQEARCGTMEFWEVYLISLEEGVDLAIESLWTQLWAIWRARCKTYPRSYPIPQSCRAYVSVIYCHNVASHQTTPNLLVYANKC